MLVGHLNAGALAFSRYDLIVPSPTYVGPGGRAFDHTGEVIARAIVEDDGTSAVPPRCHREKRGDNAVRGRTWQQRRQIAESELRQALSVPDPGQVRAKRILVFDDVYTEGLTIREVARCLRLAGASEVSEIVLARQPYGGR